MPSQLHDWLGIGNKFNYELGEIWPELTKEWVKDAKISQEGYWEGHFLGNALRNLFEDISFLLDEYGYPKEPLMAPCIRAIKSFDEVRERCFCIELADDYGKKLDQFRHDCLASENLSFSVPLRLMMSFSTTRIGWMNGSFL